LILEIGTNLTLKDKSLSIITPIWIKYLKEREQTFRGKMDRVKPRNGLLKQKDLEGFITLNPIRLPR